MSVEAMFAVWEAYFRNELSAHEAACRLADLEGSLKEWGFALPDVPDAAFRAEEVVVAFISELQRRGSLPGA